MLAGISITCFAASYTVALLLEITRLFFRSGVRGAVMLGFAAAGLLAHTLFLVYRAATATGTPLSSQFDWYLLAAWTLVATYLVWTLYHSRTAVGLFVLPIVLALIAVARFFADDQPFPRAEALRVWVVVHLAFQLTGAVAVIVGFVGGLMCLLQSYLLKHKLPPTRGFRLPSLEWLERVNARSIIASAVLLGLGFLCGLVLNLVAGRVPWTDLVVWRSGLLTVWLAAAAVFTLVYEPARRGRKVAYLTVTTFLLLVLTKTIDFVFPSEHGPARPEAASAALPPELAGIGPAALRPDVRVRLAGQPDGADLPRHARRGGGPR